LVRFQIFFGDALKTHVEVCCSRPLCWHFCWYRGSERSLRISLFRTRELTRSLQNLGCLDQLGKVQTFRYCEAGFLSLPTPRDTGERNCFTPSRWMRRRRHPAGLELSQRVRQQELFPPKAKVTRSNRVGCASFSLFYSAICAPGLNSSAVSFERVSNLKEDRRRV